jgi:hypothetical protein
MQCKFNSVFTYLQCIINRNGLSSDYRSVSAYFDLVGGFHFSSCGRGGREVFFMSFGRV